MHSSVYPAKHIDKEKDTFIYLSSLFTQKQPYLPINKTFIKKKCILVDRNRTLRKK